MDVRDDGTIEFEITEQTPHTPIVGEQMWAPTVGRRARRRWWWLFTAVVAVGAVVAAAGWYTTRQDRNDPATVPAAAAGCLAAVTSELVEGDRGDGVWCLESTLVRLGYLTVADSVFDHATDAAVRAFQQNAGRTVDGRVGPRTRASILEAEAAAADG